MNDKKRLVWFIFLRVIVVSIFMVSTIILDVKEPDSFSDNVLSGLIQLIVATYLFSIISLVVLRITRFSERFQQSFTYVQIIWDLLLITILFLLTGGISSPFSFLYILSIINASVLLSRREAFYSASLCAILYGSILDLQYYGKLGIFGLSQGAAQQYGTNYIFYTMFVNILAYYVTAFLTGYLAERVRKSESALLEKEIDYEELERLNSSIVYNLDSGLLTITSSGRIRVFNRYVSDLTGISQEDAYDRPLSSVIPGFVNLDEDDLMLQRGELEYRPQAGGIVTLGFKTVPFFDKEGHRAGLVVALQDITRIKTMESELKKADRLAAIGELSARIAHEIRNPLASISGSVQLIAQGDKIDVHDKKLLDIVLRETTRLNELISDFLEYARPNSPMKITIQLRQFLVDLAALLRTDPRFEKVQIVNECPDDVTVDLDRNQFQQVFWNLLVNGAEALSPGGTITIGAEELVGEAPADYPGNVVKITVADNGKGMSREELKRVFEPFFTTKTGGTGLGLATVYRIIESHSGVILVDSTIGKGTVFTLYLPAPSE